jgi:hypothetical protein
MFGDSMLSIIYRHMRDKVIEVWIKLNKEMLNDLNSPPNIIGLIKSRKRDGRRM